MRHQYEQKEILAVSANEKFFRYLKENLPDNDYSLTCSARCGSEARQQMMRPGYALAVVNFPLPDESGTELVTDLAENTTCSVIAVVKAEQEEELRHYLEPFGVFVLARPFPNSAMRQAFLDAAAAYARLKTVSMENQRLQTKLLDLRIINRAKWVLIRYVGMDEDSAHKFIEQEAMNLRISKRVAAENILKTYENET